MIADKGLLFFALYIIYKNLVTIIAYVMMGIIGKKLIDRLLGFIEKWREQNIQRDIATGKVKEDAIQIAREEFRKEIVELCELEKKQ